MHIEFWQFSWNVSLSLFLMLGSLVFGLVSLLLVVLCYIIFGPFRGRWTIYDLYCLCFAKEVMVVT